ncbi:MAG: CHRD domain-containing protein [Verrucomicrobiota bacterium JB023]|nr:CHRD domain-containing protein [Verrucomicrobiota bacterium JB023]
MKPTLKASFCGLLVISLTAPLSGAVIYQAILTPEAVVPGVGDDDPAGVSTASGRATFIHNELEGSLDYEIIVDGLVFSSTMPRPTLTGPSELIRGVHFHFGAPGINGGHALNSYGAPREDDGDLFVDPSLRRITGSWDDGDENPGPDNSPGMGDSVALSDALAALENGEIYVQIHTMQFRQGELRGQIVPIPEPGVSLLGGIALVALLRRDRRS